ncbi:hypothetical protein ABZP36_025465 [Zizania latifolia]
MISCRVCSCESWKLAEIWAFQKKERSPACLNAFSDFRHVVLILRLLGAGQCPHHPVLSFFFSSPFLPLGSSDNVYMFATLLCCEMMTLSCFRSFPFFFSFEQY